MADTPRAEWQRHATGRARCERCNEGFPQPCPCGGRVHGELLDIPENGFVQLTRCERCEKLEEA